MSQIYCESCGGELFLLPYSGCRLKQSHRPYSLHNETREPVSKDHTPDHPEPFIDDEYNKKLQEGLVGDIPDEGYSGPSIPRNRSKMDMTSERRSIPDTPEYWRCPHCGNLYWTVDREGHMKEEHPNVRLQEKGSKVSMQWSIDRYGRYVNDDTYNQFRQFERHSKRLRYGRGIAALVVTSSLLVMYFVFLWFAHVI